MIPDPYWYFAPDIPVVVVPWYGVELLDPPTLPTWGICPEVHPDHPP